MKTGKSVDFYCKHAIKEIEFKKERRLRMATQKEIYWVIVNPINEVIWIEYYYKAIYIFTKKEKAKSYILKKKLIDAAPCLVDLNKLYYLNADKYDYIIIDAVGAYKEEVNLVVLEKGMKV